MPGNRRHLTEAGGEPRALCLRLVRLVLVELPDARVLLENRARVHALRAGPAIRILAGVRRRAHVDVETATAVEGNALVLVLPLVGQAADDRLGRTGRLQRAVGQLEALDHLRVRQVDVAVAQRDAGRAAGAEALDHLELAVFVGVAQRNRAAAGLRLAAPAARHQRYVQIAVGGHGHVPGGAEIVGDDQRAESRRQRDAAVAGVAGRQPLAVHRVHQRRRHQRDRRGRAERPRAEAPIDLSDRHASSPARHIDRCAPASSDGITRLQSGPSGSAAAKSCRRGSSRALATALSRALRTAQSRALRTAMLYRRCRAATG